MAAVDLKSEPLMQSLSNSQMMERLGLLIMVENGTKLARKHLTA